MTPAEIRKTLWGRSSGADDDRVFRFSQWYLALPEVRVRMIVEGVDTAQVNMRAMRLLRAEMTDEELNAEWVRFRMEEESGQ